MSFFIQYLHLKFHSFIGFQHGSDSSVKVIMRLLPLAIGLKCFWYLIALLLHLKSAILVFKRILTKESCQYILNLMLKKKLGSFNDLIINTYFQSFICLPIYGLPWYWYEHFLASIFCKLSLALLNRIQPILERLNGNITKPWKPSIIHRSNKGAANIGTHSNSRD